MKNAIIYTFVFLAIQVMASFIVNGIWQWAFGKEAMSDATGIIVTTLVFTVVSVALFLLAKWCEVSGNCQISKSRERLIDVVSKGGKYQEGDSARRDNAGCRRYDRSGRR